MNQTSNRIQEWYEERYDHEALLFTGLESAFVGTAERINMPAVAVYDWHLLVKSVMDDTGGTYDEAVEYVEFNVAGAYVGESTPLILNRPDWVNIAVGAFDAG